MHKIGLACGLIFTTLCTGCSGENVDATQTGGTGGRASGGSSGSGGASAGSGGASAGSGGTGGSAGTAGKSGSGGSGGSGGAATEVGVCGQRGEATIGTDTFEGFEEFYIIGEGGFGEDICVVRFDVTRAGDAPDGCADTEGMPCMWTHMVEYSNPSVELDEGGVCANSDLGFDDEKMAELDGSRAAYGFVSEYQGHNSVVLKYDSDLDMYVPFGNATFDEENGVFRFDRRDGFCNFAAPP